MMGLCACAAFCDKPIYYLQFSIARADVEVRLNDIPVLRHDAPGLTESEKPVPESIVNGENILVVMMSPLEEEADLFIDQKSTDVRLVVREKNAPLDQYETLLHINIEVSEDQTKVLSDSQKDKGKAPPELVNFDRKSVVARRKVEVDSPFAQWEWQSGKSIDNSQESYESLLNEYKKIYQTLKSENMDKIKKLYSSAAQEYAAAYHYGDINKGFEIMNIGSLVGDPEWELGDINQFLESGFSLELEVYADGKLAHLVDEYGLDSGIVYLNKEVEMVSFQKFGFYKNSEGEWVLIR